MNVKPGDLAIMIKSVSQPELVGLIVNVVEFLDQGNNRWGCTVARPVTIRDVFTGLRGSTCRLSIPDAHLRPVSGLPDNDSDDTDTPIDKPLEELLDA